MSISEELNQILNTKETIRVKLGFPTTTPFKDYVKTIDPAHANDTVFPSTMQGQLDRLSATKESLRLAIGLPTSTPFSEYAEAIELNPYDVASMFAGGKNGFWYDISDLSTLFQDNAMTIPVVNHGDAVRAVADKSGNGNHLKSSRGTGGMQYFTDGARHWIDYQTYLDEYHTRLTQTLHPPYTAITTGTFTGSSDSSGVTWYSPKNLPTTLENNYVRKVYNKSTCRVYTNGTFSDEMEFFKKGVPNTLITYLPVGTGTSSLDNTLQETFVSDPSSIDKIYFMSDPLGELRLDMRIFSIIFVEGAIADEPELRKHLARKSGSIINPTP